MHPDHLEGALTRSQWLGWLAWMVIRGPIGPQRQDFYTQFVAMHAGKPYPPGTDISVADFPMPWAPEPVAEDDENDDG